MVGVVAAAAASWADPCLGLAAWTIVLAAAAAAYVLTDGPEQGLLAGVALAAVVQVVSFTLPGRGIDEVWRIAAVAAIVAPAALVLRRLPGLSDLPVPTRVGPAIVVLVVATVPLALVARWIGGPWHAVDGLEPAVVAVAVAFAAVVEELCFRRIVHVGARAVAGQRAFILSAIVWASGIAGMRSVPAIALLLVAGAAYALAYEWSGRWWPGAISHAAVAVLVFVVLPH